MLFAVNIEISKKFRLKCISTMSTDMQIQNDFQYVLKSRLHKSLFFYTVLQNLEFIPAFIFHRLLIE